MHRRAFLKLGPTTYVFSGSLVLSGAFTLRSAQAQIVEAAVAIEIAIELAPYFEGVCKLIETFHSEDRASFERIEKGIADLNATVASLVQSLKKWQKSFELALSRQELNNILLEIKSTEDNVLTEVRAIQGGGSLQASNLKEYAREQHKNRSKLVGGGFGPSVYPYIARSFVSQALALCTLGDSEQLFNECQKKTKEALIADAGAFFDFARHPNAVADGALAEVTRNAVPTYIGSSCGFSGCDAYYVDFDGAMPAAATKPKLHVQQKMHDWDEWPKRWRWSEYLDYDNNGSYDADDMADRKAVVRSRLKSKVQTSETSRKQASTYIDLGRSALNLTQTVAHMAYPKRLVENKSG